MIRRLLLFVTTLILSASTLRAQQVMLQGFYWDFPKPPQGRIWADTLRLKAAALAQAGFTHIWYPPFAGNGARSGGYDPRDLYIGPDNTVTSAGTKLQLKAMVDEMATRGITPVADMVYNHRDGGAPESNPAVKDYMTTFASGNNPSCGFKRPFPSDRVQLVMPIGGSTGLGVGTYTIRMRSKGSIFNGAQYMFYVTTNVVGGSRWSPVNPAVVDLTTDPANPYSVELGRNYLTKINSDGDVDDYTFTLSASQFTVGGDRLFIQAINYNSEYSDHLPISITYDADGAGPIAPVETANYLDPFGTGYKLDFQTYTDFSAMPSGQGSLHWDGFRPNFDGSSQAGWSQTTCLGPEYSMQSLDYFYDYDHNRPNTRSTLVDWTEWTYDYLQSHGLRCDAVKHFEPEFMAHMIQQMIARGKTPNLVVGEWYGENLDELKGWVDAVQSSLSSKGVSGFNVKVFDFSLRAALKGALDRSESPRQVIFTGLKNGKGVSGFNIVTFLNNHDFREETNRAQNNALANKNRNLAYAYLLTNNQLGIPLVFYPDYYGYPAQNTVYNGETVGFGWHPDNATDRAGHQAEIDRLIKVLKTYINGSQSVAYLNHYGGLNNGPGAPNNFINGSDYTKLLLYQLNATGSAGGKDVIVAINFGTTRMQVDHAIAIQNGITTGTTFTDILGNSAFPTAVVDGQSRIYIDLPAKSYSVWVRGTNPLIALPVTLVSFRAKGGPDRVQLSWRAAAEKDLSSYTVQRAADGRNFNDRAVIQPTGTTTGPADYAVNDTELPSAGTLYYRLKMTDRDGSVAFSKTEAVTIDPRGLYISVSPNPTHGTIHAELTSPDDDLPVLLTLTDASGRAVRTISRSLRKGVNAIELDVPHLPIGSYTLQATDGARKATERVLVE
ncbi:T9SS type A sorting domain-containing protein [Fibrella aquatilis]|uniref:T9SS type A sorting domain-containing protein n=1 Tax=Fibrella aquatilis TaxID=2817059 RepID=A0A939K0A5_9BACT|nr:alpha-amylase family glycosyl hydrolase [Fibrella aquatilis]MBO0932273.1 T9SS type A sorting domain-containing protein [Fibrella aquatilis]